MIVTQDVDEVHYFNSAAWHRSQRICWTTDLHVDGFWHADAAVIIAGLFCMLWLHQFSTRAWSFSLRSKVAKTLFFFGTPFRLILLRPYAASLAFQSAAQLGVDNATKVKGPTGETSALGLDPWQMGWLSVVLDQRWTESQQGLMSSEFW